MSTQGDFIGVRAFTPWSPVMSVVRMPCVRVMPDCGGLATTISAARRKKVATGISSLWIVPLLHVLDPPMHGQQATLQGDNDGNHPGAIPSRLE